MGRKEKINNFKSITGTNDNSLAEKYLIRTDWDEEKAIQLYFEDSEKNNNNKNNNNKNNNNINNNINNKDKPIKGKFNFKITEALNKIKEVDILNDKDSFYGLVKFLEQKFYVSQNFSDFFSSLKKAAGLIIIFSKEKIIEVRNNMIRATNNALCADILKSTTIFPVMKDTQACNELIKQIKPKDYPVYLFCKYNSSQMMTIYEVVEKKFRLNDVINYLLDCFPDNDVKQSLYNTINASIVDFRNKKNKEKEDDFSGDEKEVNTLINKLQNDIKICNTIFRRDNTFDDYLANYNANNENQNNQIKKENNDNNNKTGNNRFQNLFDNDVSSQIFSNDKDQEENILNIPISTKEKLEKKEDIIPEEPDENDPNSCKITFRYPYDEKHKQRRFNKTDKIEVLYNYVKSLGREIFSKPNFQTFELIYGFPPLNFENKKNQTLEEEGLFPSSTINIIEK